MQRNSHNPMQFRRGISLFEVVLAFSIFLGALTAITQVLRTGSRAAIRAQLESEAVLICEQRLNEVVAGVVPLQGVNRVPLDGKSNWFWTLAVNGTETPNLLRLDVTVEHDSQNPDSKVRCQLSRLLRDPQIYVDAANASSTTGGSL